MPDNPGGREAGLSRAHAAAVAAAQAMLRAAEREDAPGWRHAAVDLKRALGKLWQLRETRDVDWQSILNLTQGMLRQFFPDGQIESLRPEQCAPILKIVERYLEPSTRTVDELAEVVRLIEEAGFDPYAAISGDPEAGLDP